jgi:transposase
VSLRERSGRPGGGQKGHKGETLRQIAEPDRIVKHEACACRHCGSGPSAAMAVGMERRQTFDLPQRLIEVTEHQGLVLSLRHLRRGDAGGFSRGREWACAIWRAHPGGGGLPQCPAVDPRGPHGGGARRSFRRAQPLACERRAVDAAPRPSLLAGRRPDWRAACGRARALSRRSFDKAQDGFRVAGRTQWLHTIATDALTLDRVSAKRGDVPKELAGGVVVHDGFTSYGGLDGVAHALCNAHHWRELKALIAFDQEAWQESWQESWAAAMRELLLEANRAVEEARQRGQIALAPDLLTAFHARYFEALREGLAYHRKLPRLPRHGSNRGKVKRRPGHNLLLRLHKFKDDVLRFLIDLDVPFTNNLGPNRRCA